MIAMKSMELVRSSWFVLVTCMVVGVLTYNRDTGDYGYFHKWRKAVCERNNQTLFDDIDLCFQMEPKSIKDATQDCINDAMPEAKGKLGVFDPAACKDISIFTKFDKCFDEYEANPAFLKQINETAELKDCYKKILVKHNLPDLMFYFE